MSNKIQSLKVGDFRVTLTTPDIFEPDTIDVFYIDEKLFTYELRLSEFALDDLIQKAKVLKFVGLLDDLLPKIQIHSRSTLFEFDNEAFSSFLSILDWEVRHYKNFQEWCSESALLVSKYERLKELKDSPNLSLKNVTDILEYEPSRLLADVIRTHSEFSKFGLAWEKPTSVFIDAINALRYFCFHVKNNYFRTWSVKYFEEAVAKGEYLLTNTYVLSLNRSWDKEQLLYIPKEDKTYAIRRGNYPDVDGYEVKKREVYLPNIDYTLTSNI